MKAAGSFDVTAWDEATYEELENGGKLTRATVSQAFSGDVAGEGSVVWLMAYRSDGTAQFVGLQRVTGALGGRSGSFLLETSGVFDGAEARGSWSILAGSGTGGLAGIGGSGHFAAPHGSHATYQLEYDLD